MKDSLEKVFLLDLKINAPWEEMKFTAWRYKVTNIVISAVHVALKAEDDDAGLARKHAARRGFVAGGAAQRAHAQHIRVLHQ